MSDFKIDEGALVAYADGELNAANASAVEKAILKDPELELKVKAFKATSQLLKETFGAESQVVPDHLAYRMREIEKKVLQESQKKTSDLDKSVESAWNPFSFLSGLLSSNFSSMSFGSGVISGSLLSGAACAILVISLGAIQPDKISISEIGEDTNKIIWRGAADEILNGYIVQNGLQIKPGGTIKSNQTFSLVIQSSISGEYKIFEQADGVQGAESIAGEINEKDSLETLWKVNNQDLLEIGIEVFNEDITVKRVFKFDIVESN